VNGDAVDAAVAESMEPEATAVPSACEVLECTAAGWSQLNEVWLWLSLASSGVRAVVEAVPAR
jgi:hypothetical protein